MKEKNNHQISIFLMVVGVLFILTAGSIFVTTAWKYLPEIVKQCCLLLASVGLFAASYLTGKSDRLKKTECVFYDLGTAFAGFFIVAVTGGMKIDIFSMDIAVQKANAVKLAASILVMLALMAARWYRKNGVQDFIVTLLLLNWLVTCVNPLVNYNTEIRVILLLGLVLFLSVLDFYRMQQCGRDKHMDTAVKICYLLQLLHCIMPLIALYLTANNTTPGILTLTAILLLAAASVSYAARPEKVYRVIQSVALLGVNWIAISELCYRVLRLSSDFPVFFVIFVVDLVVMVCLNRSELFGILLVLAALMSMGQGSHMTADSPQIESLLPYALTFGFAGLVLCVREKNNFYLRASVLQLLSGLFLSGMTVYALAVGGVNFRTMTGIVLLLLAAGWCTIAEGVYAASGDRCMRQALWMVALIHGIPSGICLTNGMLNLTKSYIVEWNCAVFALGIVLLGYIWYDKKQVVDQLQFILTCLLLVILLLHDVVSGGLGNVLILGVTCVTMILAAAVRNRRDYVIAASIALALIVIYITRAFWLSIAWWVYLFAAGVILIVFAVKKEKEA